MKGFGVTHGQGKGGRGEGLEKQGFGKGEDGKGEDEELKYGRDQWRRRPDQTGRLGEYAPLCTGSSKALRGGRPQR